MQIVRYKPAKYGLGTESSQNFQPMDFSPDITNRFYNLLGDLEKRPGVIQLGNTITTAFSADVSAQIKNIHEYVDTSGNTTLFASGAVTNSGNTKQASLWRYSDVSAVWQQLPSVGSVPLNGPLMSSNTMFSVQMNDKLIFCNGADRNFYLDKAAVAATVATTQQLYSTITKGTLGSGTTTSLVFDADISNWKTQTNVAINDLILTKGTSNNLGGIVTSVGTTSLDVTLLGGGTGLGVGTAVAVGNPYRIVDLVELNIIQSASLAGGAIYDNVTVAGAATSSTVITVTALNFSTTDIRAGDYVYNTTRAAITQVISVSANIKVNTVTSQTAGDSLVFLKDAMPIATYPHVHYSQLYLIDARDTTKIRVSGPNDPEDFTTFSKTLSSSTLDYGSTQSKGDILLTMNTFQRYFVVGGQQNLYVIDGTIPIAEVTADVIDLQPTGLFPQGVVSPRGLANIGNEMLYLARDGLRSFLAAFSSNNTTTSNKSEQIKSQLIADIQTLLDNPDQLQLAHYPRRNWVVMKIGSNVYNYNYTPMYQMGMSIYTQPNYPTITQFGGVFQNISCFFVRRNGDLVLGSNDGKIYVYDNGAQLDSANIISTRYVSPWHSLQEGQTELPMIIKDGRYIKPLFESFGDVEYNISVVGNYDQLATDSVIVTAAGAVVVGQSVIGNAVIGSTAITNPKMGLRWRGEQCQITIETSSESGGDIINSYSLYGNVFGRR